MTLGKHGLLYTWQVGAVTIRVDEADNYLTVHTSGQLVCSTQPAIQLFIPGHWLHMIAPYMDAPPTRTSLAKHATAMGTTTLMRRINYP